MSELTYTTSRDYERLADLMERGVQVLGSEGEFYNYYPHNGCYERSIAGCYDIWGESSREEFIVECEARDIEFLDPELPAQQAARIEELETALDEALAYLALEGDYYEEPIARLKAVMKGGKS